MGGNFNTMGGNFNILPRAGKRNTAWCYVAVILLTWLTYQKVEVLATLPWSSSWIRVCFAWLRFLEAANWATSNRMICFGTSDCQFAAVGRHDDIEERRNWTQFVHRSNSRRFPKVAARIPSDWLSVHSHFHAHICQSSAVFVRWLADMTRRRTTCGWAG